MPDSYTSTDPAIGSPANDRESSPSLTEGTNSSFAQNVPAVDHVDELLHHLPPGRVKCRENSDHADPRTVESQGSPVVDTVKSHGAYH